MKAIEILNQEAKHLRDSKYPNVPSYAKPPIKYSDATTNGLTKAIIDFVRIRGGQAERISSEGRVIDDRKSYTNVIGQTVTVGSIRRIKTSGQKGTADISATINGRSVKIEVKKGRDYQSQAQQEYQESIVKAGGIYFVAKDFEMFLDWYNKTFLSYE
jgi:hypothetical protein